MNTSIGEKVQKWADELESVIKDNQYSADDYFAQHGRWGAYGEEFDEYDEE